MVLHAIVLIGKPSGKGRLVSRQYLRQDVVPEPQTGVFPPGQAAGQRGLNRLQVVPERQTRQDEGNSPPRPRASTNARAYPCTTAASAATDTGAPLGTGSGSALGTAPSIRIRPVTT